MNDEQLHVGIEKEAGGGGGDKSKLRFKIRHTQSDVKNEKLLSLEMSVESAETG